MMLLLLNFYKIIATLFAELEFANTSSRPRPFTRVPTRVSGHVSGFIIGLAISKVESRSRTRRLRLRRRVVLVVVVVVVVSARNTLMSSPACVRAGALSGH